jgi:hypothetical protein
LSHLASSLKLETAPTAGPWPQAATAWMEPRLSGSAACPRCPVLCSCCLPCNKCQTQLTFDHAAARSSPSLAVTAAPGDGIWLRHWAGRKCPLQLPCRSDSEACLDCCIAPASPTHARVMQLSLSCCGLVGGAQARDFNLLYKLINRPTRSKLATSVLLNADCSRLVETARVTDHTSELTPCAVSDQSRTS